MQSFTQLNSFEMKVIRPSLAKYRDARTTLLVLACIIAFLDEVLMTVPVPIIPNLFLAQCEAEIAHGELRVPRTAIDNTDTCSDTLSEDLGVVCDRELTNSTWSFVYILNGTNAHCKVHSGGGEACSENLFRTDSSKGNDCYEASVTDDLCDHWQGCEDDVNVRIGVILSAKFVLRILLSSFVAVLPKYFGFLPIFYACVLLGMASCTVYAATTTFTLILLARLIHGIAASLTVGSSGFTIYVYRDDDKKRGVAIGLLIASMALGSVVGPPFGGLLFYFFGNSAPYLTLVAIYAIFLGTMFLLLRDNPKDDSVTSASFLDFFKILMDPYVAISCLGFVFAGTSVSIIESALPHWMITTMASSAWIQGAIYFPMAFMAVPFSVLAGYTGAWVPRWVVALAGFLCTGSSLMLIPYCTTPGQLILPMALLGTGFGTLDSTLSALIVRFGHERHGGMYAVSSVVSGASFSMGFALGPIIMSSLINTVGFHWLILGLGCFVFLFSGACLILRNGEISLSETEGNNADEKQGEEEDEEQLISR